MQSSSRLNRQGEWLADRGGEPPRRVADIVEAVVYRCMEDFETPGPRLNWYMSGADDNFYNAVFHEAGYMCYAYVEGQTVHVLELL